LRETNVTNDADLESARKAVERTLLGVSPEELRKNEAVRSDIKSQVEGILDKFNW